MIFCVLPNFSFAQALQSDSHASKVAGPEIISGQSRQPNLRRAPEKQTSSDLPPTAPILDTLKPLPQDIYPKRKHRRQAKHRLDQNRDGLVSKSEFELEHQTKVAAFRAADKNQDGKLDAAELRQYQATVRPRQR